MSKIILTKDQEISFKRVKEFLTDEANPAIVIAGSAGVGKTRLMRHIVDYLIDTGQTAIAAVAPTHKARRVLEKTLNLERFLPIPSFTVASLLGKMREHTYIGSHKYTNGSRQKMDKYTCFILDEVSMVGDKDLEAILDYICKNDKKIILVGDNCQIPCPSQKLVIEGHICYKPDSCAFEIANMCEMKEIVRQAAESPIIQIATYLREHLVEDSDLHDILTSTGLKEEAIVTCQEDAYVGFMVDWKAKLDVRMIAYTNAAVRTHNRRIRDDLGLTTPLIVGELLTGYDNVGWPVPVIENGTDYKVLAIQTTAKHHIAGYTGLVGDLVDLIDMVDPTNISRKLFFINARHSQNQTFMLEFVRRAEKVNERLSTKHAYKRYCELKNGVLFLEDIYKYTGTIMTETDFRQSQPLLFTKVSEVINVSRKTIAVSELTRKLDDQYGELVEGRLIDNKPFADGEVFADQYMVVEKNIYYGYALTAHKSQGSTYDSVYVDENDFKKIVDKWNYRLRAIEQRCKERNQLKYVAYTRASQKLRLIL